MQAYGFDGVTWAQAGALMILLRLGSVVPQAPGNVGLFQVLSTLWPHALRRSGRDGAPLHAHLVGVVTLPLLIVGFVALWPPDRRWATFSAKAQAEMRARQDELAKS